ncbi:MAG: hypothetical protein B7Y58_05375, partial [Halothiobacillus sp. 35-54-62]
HPWGGGQLALTIQGAEPAFIGHFATLLTDLPRALGQVGASLQPPDAKYWAQLRHALPQDTLPAIWVALRAAEIRLSGLQWQSSAGQFELAGEAFGPRFTPSTPQKAAHKPPPLTWQVHAQLRTALADNPPQDAPTNLSYGADGWQINGQSVDSSAIFP